MEKQNNRQGINKRENQDNDFMNRVGQTIKNVVDEFTYDDQDNGQQKDRNNNRK